ncbi:uncharacterized protein LOC124922449 [Impatiens glandulifera]|uniref:uncharacterized protein LOC124922449 n=1 Tax=Impatiens glandulifera TaxID=253017 RepID=UPI001FB076E2|nr:uncharacterized protein LOC124922449 [Impatiens glandulifera]
MADYTTENNLHHQHQQQQTLISKETALQALNTIVQLHFEKTLEKKRAVDAQKKELWKLFQIFFLFLSIIFATISLSPSHRLQCRHCWIPIGLLSLAHLIFYVSVAQILRCVNGFKYQRRCHKLTLGLATERLRQMKMRYGGGGGGEDGGIMGDDFEIHYQEPPESYFGKFKRNWALHFGFLIFVYGFMISSTVVLICF